MDNEQFSLVGNLSSGLPTPGFILGIDPGTTQSGWVTINRSRKIQASGVSPNLEILKIIDELSGQADVTLAMEWIQSMGMAVGKEVFETCLWAGRFVERAAKFEHRLLIPRGAIKLHHCHSARANDSNICQSLRDKYGDKGTKRAPGYFFGVSKHAWQAFASAAYVIESGPALPVLRY